MKKTAMQLLIDKLSDKKDEHEFNTNYDDGVRRGLALAIEKATELLETERENLEEGVKFGLRQRHDVFQGQEHTDAEQYYKETYG